MAKKNIKPTAYPNKIKKGICRGSFVIAKSPEPNGIEYIAEVGEIDKDTFSARYKRVFVKDPGSGDEEFKEYKPNPTLNKALPDKAKQPDLANDTFDLREVTLISGREFDEVIMPIYFPNKDNYYEKTY